MNSYVKMMAGNLLKPSRAIKAIKSFKNDRESSRSKYLEQRRLTQNINHLDPNKAVMKNMNKIWVK